MNNHLASESGKTDFFLGDLEQRASERNLMFAMYKHSKQTYGVRPTIHDLTQLTNEGEVEVDGVRLLLDRGNGNPNDTATINGNEFDITPLFEGIENSTDFDYNQQRKIYLEGVIKFQDMYITYDSKGVTDAFGVNHNTVFNEKKVADALSELEPDYEGINPNGFFKAEMTKTQKIRLMSSYIDTIKADVKKTSRKLAVEEKAAIKKPLVDKQLAQSVKDILSGAIDPIEATKRDKTHEIDANHHYVQNTLKGIEGINDTKNFAVSHLKPMPKDYETQQTLLRRITAITYGDDESNISIIAKQLTAFQAAKEIITNAPKVDFENGIDLERLFVSTKRLAGAIMVDGKSCVMDANEKYRNVNSGDFALPRSSLLNKPIKDYDSIVVSVGASAAGAISVALKDREDVLVIDALRDDNVNRVLFDIREHHDTPILVFTDSKDIDNYLSTSRDNRLTSNLSKHKGWGELGVDAIRANRFDDFANIIESKIDNFTPDVLTTPQKPVIRENLNESTNTNPLTATHANDQQPTTPNNHRYQMGL